MAQEETLIAKGPLVHSNIDSAPRRVVLQTSIRIIGHNARRRHTCSLSVPSAAACSPLSVRNAVCSVTAQCAGSRQGVGSAISR